MFIKKMAIFIFLIGFLFNISIIYSNENPNENPNDISNYYLEAIENRIINPLSSLEEIDKERYDIIVNHIFSKYENEIIENYYYSIGLNPEDEEYIYVILYYEIFFNKYKSYRGDPTGKCFLLIFNENQEYFRIEYFR